MYKSKLALCGLIAAIGVIMITLLYFAKNGTDIKINNEVNNIEIPYSMETDKTNKIAYEQKQFTFKGQEKTDAIESFVTVAVGIFGIAGIWFFSFAETEGGD